MKDSKALWLDLRSKFRKHDVRFGAATSADYVHDPKHLVFVASRYKFAAKMIENVDSVLEIGCGDAFGAPILAQAAGRVYCTDIDEETLADNRDRLRLISEKISFHYHDFRAQAFSPRVDAVVMVDVIEHIYLEEEDAVLRNIHASLNPKGIAIIGTPNIAAEAYSSPNSKIGHVNLKDQRGLKESCSKIFNNVFMFSQNDEVVHTGYAPMSHYLWAVCAYPKADPGQ